MHSVNILTYNSGSKSARGLTGQLITNLPENQYQVRRFHRDSPRTNRMRTRPVQALSDRLQTFIKWGSISGLRELPNDRSVLSYNFGDYPWAVNKLEFFNTFGDTGMLPDYWTDAETVAEYLRTAPATEAPLVVERGVLNGHSGEGIRLLGNGMSPDPSARLWVKYTKKKREFRCHFIRNKDSSNRVGFKYWQEKRLRLGNLEPAPNRFQIRNHSNGWIYSTSMDDVPRPVSAIVNDFISLENNTLDFGAVDIIYTEQNNSAKILEVNTAPGLEGRTLAFYSNTFASAIYNSAERLGRAPALEEYNDPDAWVDDMEENN